jgi:hypothetical protein
MSSYLLQQAALSSYLLQQACSSLYKQLLPGGTREHHEASTIGQNHRQKTELKKVVKTIDKTPKKKFKKNVAKKPVSKQRCGKKQKENVKKTSEHVTQTPP